MSLHSYPRSALVGDYIRAGAGFALTAGPLIWVKPASMMVYILGGLAILFAIFGIRTYVRQATRLELAAEGIRTIGPFGSSQHSGFDVKVWARLQALGRAPEHAVGDRSRAGSGSYPTARVTDECR